MSLSHRFVFALAVMLAPAAAQATTTYYQQVFPPPTSGSTIPPWSINMIGGFQGTFSGSFDPGGLRDATSNLPIGRTGPGDAAGTAVFTGIGGAVTQNLRAFYTVDGQPGDHFSSFEPGVDCVNCYLNIWANRQAGGADDVGYFIVGQINNTNTFDWYVSSTPMATPVPNGGVTYQEESLAFNPSAANWNKLTISPTNAVAPIVGPASAIPAGTIDGVGVLMSVTSPAGDFSSWNFSDYRITCGGPAVLVPEPASLVLMACGGLALLWFRRAK
jgi:hypothetical protein